MSISMETFAARREALLAQLAPNSACIVTAARQQTRSNDTEYPFRQNSDFWYLTGFAEPDALLLMMKSAEGETESVLFCLAKDPAAEIWHGRRVGPEQAVDRFGFDQAHPLEDLAEGLVAFLDGHRHLYFAQGQDSQWDECVFSALQTLRNAPRQRMTAPASLHDVRPLLHEMRLFKSEEEIALMRRAAEISAGAHMRAMRAARDAEYEYQLEAELHYEFARNGARFPAYASIVGSGENACILHYTENSDPLDSGDLVLIDAGCEYQGYAADITRTFPVSGRFTDEQKALYQIVLDAQLASMQLLMPGSTLKRATDRAIEVITDGLLSLGLLQGSRDEAIANEDYRAFFMHGLGHWLGLDVHDMGDYKIDGEDRPLRPGMALTVEPGIYVAPDAEVDERWRGIGIRIEDNIVITDDGHQVLTDAVPKTIEDIESLMAAD